MNWLIITSHYIPYFHMRFLSHFTGAWKISFTSVTERWYIYSLQHHIHHGNYYYIHTSFTIHFTRHNYTTDPIEGCQATSWALTKWKMTQFHFYGYSASSMEVLSGINHMLEFNLMQFDWITRISLITIHLVESHKFT